MEEKQPIIMCRNLCKTFKIAQREKGLKNAIKSLFSHKFVVKEALKDVNFEIDAGEIVGYIGPNGAGKSTTIKIMTGILHPSSGEVIIDGFVPWKDRKKYVKEIGVVFGQRSQLWWDVPVIDSFELLKTIYKVPQKQYDETLKKLTKILDLDDLLKTPLRQLSLGQKMKCELAGSLIHSPKILFLDEPTIGLDAVTKLAVRKFIKELNREFGVTIILTTHDMNDIEALTNKIILIGKGQILYNGTFSAVKKKFGAKKTITVEFEKEYANVKSEKFELVSHDKNVAVFQTDDPDFNIVHFIQDLSAKYEIRDFNVQSLNTEEVLAKLYQEFSL